MIGRLLLRFHAHKCTVVLCDRGRFWRDKHSNVVDDLEHVLEENRTLRAELRARDLADRRALTGLRHRLPGFASWGAE